MGEPVKNINLALGLSEYLRIDAARPSTVPRTHWIRGAIRKRLEAEAVPSLDALKSSGMVEAAEVPDWGRKLEGTE